jgi:microcystin degradation protein MlrC
MKILIAGFQHETNTFAPTKASYQSFVQGEGFPPLTRGADVLNLRDVNVPIGGFIRATEAACHELIPVIWAGASASAHVTEDAYERIAGEIVDAVRAGGFDAIYLDLHGAMVAEHIDDGEGELLARVRGVVGDDMPLVVSLDLHANVTDRMLQLADAIVAYRTYPHVDMAETGERAAALLDRLTHDRRPLKRVSRRIPFLIPVNAMCTLVEPALGVYDMLVIWGYGYDEDALVKAIDALHARMLADEAQWDVRFLSPDEAVNEASRLAQHAEKPVIIADTQDNPGVGGDSNTMGMVRALLRHRVQDAAVGVIWDAQAAAAAHRAGVGARIELALAGRSGVPGDAPLQGVFEVEHLSDGRFRFDGPMMNGMQGDLGPVACLRIDGVRIVVSTIKMQIFERNFFRVGGVEPERMKVLVVKSSVHFRADFQAGAHAVLVAKAPGPMAADPADLPWRRLDGDMRVRPMGLTFGEFAVRETGERKTERDLFGINAAQA